MKRVLLFLLFVPMLLTAQTNHNVTFKVDMSDYTGTFTNVYVSGTFNSWGGTSNQLLDADGDSIYEAVVSVPAGPIEWKYQVDAWAGQENFLSGTPCTVTNGGFTNRSMDVTADVVLPTVCWESCNSCGYVAPIVNVTFKVDMNQYTGTYTNVHVNGPFSGWCGSCAGTQMSDPDGDGIYELVAPLPAGSMEYKFTIDGWADQEQFNGGESCTVTNSGFTNRNIIYSADTVLDVVCFNSCAACAAGPVLTQIDLPITFDDSTVNYTVSDFGGNISQLVADPMGGTNMVLESNKPIGAQLWAGTTLSTNAGLATAIPFSATANVMTVMVYSPDAGIPVRLKVEDATDPTISVETEALTTMANAWEMLSFDFTNHVTGTAAIDYNNTYDKASIFYNFGTDGNTAGDKTYYCDNVMMASGGGTNPTACGDLIISEYIEGSGSNKALELYNPTSSAIDLSLYSVYCNVNAGSFNNLSNPQGMIAPYGTYVMVNSNADSALAAMADTLLSGFSAVNFNGDDAILLVKGSDTLDIIGEVDIDPGSSWPVGSGSTQNHTLVRMATVDMGETDWVVGATQWDVYPTDTYTDLGTHTSNCANTGNPCVVSMLPYSEDFEAGFPACWDTTQNAGSNGFMWGDATTMGSQFWPVPAHTNFMASNDDVCDCDMSNDLLRSPQFDLSGYAGQLLDLSFEYYGDQNYGSIGTVWYSMNGGPLMLLDSMAPSPAAAWAASTLDVSAVAGSDSVVFVWKHDDQGAWADGVAVDDVSVSVAPDPCMVMTLPYTEDFETGGMPACWDTTHNAGSNGFMWGDATAMGSQFWPVPAHTNFMASNDDACDCDMSNDLLWTPPFDLSGYAGQSLNLSFEYYGDQNYGSVATVWYSMNGGPLVLLDSVPPSPATAWANRTLDVSMLAGVDSVGFVFKHDDGGAWADGVAVDDVMLDVADTDSDVTFKVDMNAYGTAFGYVNFSSNINNWCGDCAQMDDSDGDGVWEITVTDIPNGPIEWKYSLDNWATDEALTPGDPCVITTGGFTNRYLDVQADTTMPVVCYASCSACPANPIDVDITFQVDMDGYTGTYTDVNLNGTFNGWCGGCATMADPDGDNVYDIIVNFSNITPGDTIEWKFTVDGWTDQENLTDGDPCTMTTIDGTNVYVNRMMVLPAMDMTIPTVCWNSCDACPSIGLEEEAGAFDMFPNPAQDQVTITWAQAGERTIRIVDAQGRVVQTVQPELNALEAVLNTSGLSAGWYTVVVESASDYKVEKLIIQE